MCASERNMQSVACDMCASEKKRHQPPPPHPTLPITCVACQGSIVPENPRSLGTQVTFRTQKNSHQALATTVADIEVTSASSWEVKVQVMMRGPLTVKVVWNKAVVVHGRQKKWMHSAFGGHGWGWIDWLENIWWWKRWGWNPWTFYHYQHFVNNNGHLYTREILAPVAFDWILVVSSLVTHHFFVKALRFPRLSLSACALRCHEEVDPKKLQLDQQTRRSMVRKTQYLRINMYLIVNRHPSHLFRGTLLGTNISPFKGTFEDVFCPFLKVGYVSSLEGTLISYFFFAAQKASRISLRPLGRETIWFVKIVLFKDSDVCLSPVTHGR